MSRINQIVNDLLEKIKSKETQKKLFKTSIIILGILFIIIFPYTIFIVQHAITGGNELYTYIDNLSNFKGEPINIIIKGGSLPNIIDRMETQEWKKVPTFSSSNKSTWQFSVKNGVTPVSPRYFEGKVQDASLEGSNSTLRHRHHARFWQVNGSIYGTVSYDSDITVIFNKLIPTPTHHISQNIDKERDSVGEIITKQSGLTSSYEDNIFPILYKSNNAGSWYYTDGEIVLITKQSNYFQKNILYFRRSYFKILGIVMNLF